jgi:nucleotide-binding universal stress UspA family protein
MAVRPVKFLVCVDNTQHSRCALKFACISAKKRGGLVDMLHVIDSADYRSYPLLAEKMRKEKQEEASIFLNDMAGLAQQCSELTPSVVLKEGDLREEILSAIEETVDANILVLGGDPSEGGKTTPLISWLTNQLGKRLLIPLLVIPGNLTDLQIEQLT